jgi:hypothetical protein
MGTLATTVALTIGAALTAGLWLTLVLWIPGNIVSAVARTDEGEYGVMVLLTLIGAFAVVFAVGVFVLDLPWYAAAIAAAIVGVTSYPRRNPDHPAHRLNY